MGPVLRRYEKRLPFALALAGILHVAILSPGCTEWRLTQPNPADADATTDADADYKHDAEVDVDGDTQPDADQDSLRDVDNPADAPNDADTDDTDEPDAEPDEEVPPLVQELEISEPGDDGEIDWNAFFPDGEEVALYIGFWGSGPTWGYFRFTIAESISATATVTAARLEIWGIDVAGDWDALSHGIEIAAEDAEDPPPVTEYADNPVLDGRPLRTTRTRWPEAGGLGWTFGWNTSPDLSPILQDLVDEFGGLEAGSHVQLWLRGDDVWVDAEVGCEDSSRPENHHTRLIIEWQP